MRIGVVGAGVVGHATARVFLEHADVRVYDLLPERSSHTLVEALEGDLIFVALPSPAGEAGLQVDYIEKFFADHKGYDRNFVLKSTTPLGTTRRLREKYDLPNLVHSPEFLTARCAVTDAHLPSRNIIGGPVCRCKSMLADLYARRFPGVPLFLCTSDESEFVKLVQNSFFHVKISFFNECKTLADRLSLNWSHVMEMVLADGRIAHSHTRVPGIQGHFGAGGLCLPKDLANMVNEIESAGLSAAITRAAMERNREDVKR